MVALTALRFVVSITFPRRRPSVVTIPLIMGHRRICVCYFLLHHHPSNIIIVDASKPATNSRGLQHFGNSNDCTSRNAIEDIDATNNNAKNDKGIITILTTNEDVVISRYNPHVLLHRSFRPLERIISRRRWRLTQQQKQQHQPMQSKKRQMYLTCSAIVFVWISSGTLFYSNYYQWPLSQSFFYAVDAGMSIGFCTDVAETRGSIIRRIHPSLSTIDLLRGPASWTCFLVE